MLNHITVMGRLVRDPAIRYTQSGLPVTSFTVACDRDFKDKATGEKATDFIDIVAWRSTAEFVTRYFSKGRMAVVDGRLQLRDWTDRDGNRRRSAEVLANNVHFGDSKPADPLAGSKRPFLRQPEKSILRLYHHRQKYGNRAVRPLERRRQRFRDPAGTRRPPPHQVHPLRPAGRRRRLFD